MKDKEIKIIDSSEDKKYFTIIPNYILNHSTANEQALYLQMKKIAGENGRCFATLQTMAKKLGWERKKVMKNIKCLLKRNWIKKDGTIPSKTHPVNAYKIVNIWELNSDYYRKKKSTKIEHISKRRESKGDLSRESKGDLEEDILIKEDKEEKKQTPSQQMKSFLEDNSVFNSIAKEFAEKEKLSEFVVIAQLQKFRSYWSELNHSGKKQKWQLERTFELKRRIGTWLRNAESFGDIQKETKVKRY